MFSVLPAHSAFDILRPFLLTHLPPPDAQGLKGICSMRSAVMAGFVAPDALLLVPFFAIAAECLKSFTALRGIKPANRKRQPRRIDGILFEMPWGNASINPSVEVALDELLNAGT